MGTFGQKCFTSGVHFSGMFSSESRIDEIKIRVISELSIYEQFKILQDEYMILDNPYLANQWRSTWVSHPYLDMIEVEAYRSPLDPQYPKGQAQPLIVLKVIYNLNRGSILDVCVALNICL